MPYECIGFEVHEKNAVVTLRRPERRNALSLGMIRELSGCLDEIAGDTALRCVILAAEGKVFSAGHDLTELHEGGEKLHREIFTECASMMEKIMGTPQPVIAEVQGLATAAGCQLAASCDLVVASEFARFATPGVKIGLFCTTPMVPLMRSVGRKRAMEMLLTGQPINAATAAEWGLVNRVVPAEKLREESLKLAGQIAEASRSTVETGKRAFHEQMDLSQSDAYARATDVMIRNLQEADAEEGILAFLEKRPPRW